MKKLLCLVLCAAALLASVFSAQAGETLPLARKAQAIADAIVESYGAVSVQYAIIDSGQIVLSGASGVFDKVGNRGITNDDMYGIGSTSKMFVVAAAMVLYDQGLIDIDKPLTDYIPDFRMADERYKQITPRMLMNHTAGFYGTHYGSVALFDDSDTTAHDNLLTLIAEQGLKSIPGVLPQYCNDGFELLEILVERVSGLNYSEFLEQSLTRPLGLENTKTTQDSFNRNERVVKAYVPIYNGALPTDTVNAIGTGGLYTTAEDLCRFAEVLMGDKPDILSEQSALMMQSKQFKNDIWLDDDSEILFARGLGWDIVDAYPLQEYGVKEVKKDGDTMLFHSALVAIPDSDIAMAVISSGGSSSVNTAFAESIVQELLYQKGVITEAIPQTTVIASCPADMPENLETYSGLYASADLEANIVVKDGILTIAIKDGGPEIQYFYKEDGTFACEAMNEYAKFIRQKDGTIYLQQSSFNTFPGVGQINERKLGLQKLDSVRVPGTVANVWNQRIGMKYYLVSEKPTSQMYFIPGFFLSMSLNRDFSTGYAYGGAKIIDENHAVNTLQLRDVNDLVFYWKDGAEYMGVGDRVYIRGDSIPEISEKITFCTIGEDGFANYYAVGSDVQGKTLYVDLPEGAAYAVYDESDVCVNFSTVSGDNMTTLPENGKIGFIGNAGDVFEIGLR